MWCDHSAGSAQGSDSPAMARVVRNARWQLSPEFDVPKLMFLKETYAAWMEPIGLALELVDFLTLKCISALERSINSLSCKFLYQPPLAVGTWVYIARLDLKRCSRTTLFALELVHSIRETRSGRA